MHRKLITTLLFLSVTACSTDNGGKEETQKAEAYLRDDPTSSSTDAMTFGQIGYWQTECRGNTALWKTAVDVCNEPGRHPPICEIIRNGCP